MLWLKSCDVPTLSHEVIIADVVYPTTVFLAHGRSLSLLFAMIGCLQSILRVLCQSFYNVVVKENNEGNVVVGPDGEPKVKTPNPHVELPYTYFMSWYVMHCSSLMSAVQSSEDSMPFASNWSARVGRLVHSNDLENSSEQHELPIEKVLPRLPRSIIWGTIF